MKNYFNPLISVIIPTYNRARYVTRAIDSALAQTYKNYEIIVVNDGSTDNTREVLEPYFTKINYVYQDNQGVSSARNTGIQHATGEWIAFLDSDDEWLPEKLSVQMHEIVQSDNNVCLHTTNHLVIHDQNNKTNNFDITGFSKATEIVNIVERPLKYQIKYGLARTPCAVIKHEALFDAGLFDPELSLYEDQDLMCRLALQGAWGVSKLELVRVYRREEDILSLSKQRINKPLKSIESLVYLYEKLSKNSQLTPEEKQLVIKTLYSYIGTLGMELIKMKEKSKAYFILRQALSQNISLKLLLKYSLTFFPNNFASWVASSWQRIRQSTKSPRLNFY